MTVSMNFIERTERNSIGIFQDAKSLKEDLLKLSERCTSDKTRIMALQASGLALGVEDLTNQIDMLLSEIASNEGLF